MNKQILVIGMGRSGTSLISKWLDRMGVFMGNKMLPGDINNPNGYFEEVELINILEDELRLNGYTGWLEYDNLEPLTLSLEGKRKIKDLIEKRRELTKHWAWKAPQITLFLNSFIELLPEALFIICLRHYEYVIESSFIFESNIQVKRRNFIAGRIRLFFLKFNAVKNKKKNKYLQSWIGHNTIILNAIKNGVVRNYVVLETTKISPSEIFSKVLYFFKKNGVNLNFISINEIYDNKLLKNRFSFSKLDENKVECAKFIYEELRTQ